MAVIEQHSTARLSKVMSNETSGGGDFICTAPLVRVENDSSGVE